MVNGEVSSQRRCSTNDLRQYRLAQVVLLLFIVPKSAVASLNASVQRVAVAAANLRIEERSARNRNPKPKVTIPLNAA